MYQNFFLLYYYYFSNNRKGWGPTWPWYTAKKCKGSSPSPPILINSGSTHTLPLAEIALKTGIGFWHWLCGGSGLTLVKFWAEDDLERLSSILRRRRSLHFSREHFQEAAALALEKRSAWAWRRAILEREEREVHITQRLEYYYVVRWVSEWVIMWERRD